MYDTKHNRRKEDKLPPVLTLWAVWFIPIFVLIMIVGCAVLSFKFIP